MSQEQPQLLQVVQYRGKVVSANGDGDAGNDKEDVAGGTMRVNADFLTKEYALAAIRSALPSEQDVTVLKCSLKSNGIQQGHNYGSLVSRMTVVYKIGSIVKRKRFFIKILFQGPIYGEMKAAGLVDKELHMYSNILPMMNQLQQHADMALSPKIYQSLHPEVLVLEDLNELGYKMLCRLDQLDYKHSLEAMKLLGRFHGTSVPLKEYLRTEMEQLRQKTEPGKNESRGRMDSWIEECLDPLINAIRETDDLRRYADPIKNLKREICETCAQVTSPNEGGLNVLNHGDYWLCNIMYRYDEQGEIIASKMIDFQLCRWCSPVTDLLHFLISSVQYDVFENRSDRLLETYVDSFQETIGRLNCQIGTTLTVAGLKRDMDRYCLYSMHIISSYLPMVLCDPEDVSLFLSAIRRKQFIPLMQFYRTDRFQYNLRKWLEYYSKKLIKE